MVATVFLYRLTSQYAAESYCRILVPMAATITSGPPTRKDWKWQARVMSPVHDSAEGLYDLHSPYIKKPTSTCDCILCNGSANGSYDIYSLYL